jgi:hypothetical protein
MCVRAALLRVGHFVSNPCQLMLVSDTLGVTMLVDCINHRRSDPRATEWTVQVGAPTIIAVRRGWRVRIEGAVAVVPCDVGRAAGLW